MPERVERRAIAGLASSYRTVPIFVPTPCIESLFSFASAMMPPLRNSLITRDNSQCLATTIPRAKCLKIRQFMVRDQEAGGSNPLAPTIYLSRYQKHAADLCDFGLRVGQNRLDGPPKIETIAFGTLCGEGTASGKETNDGAVSASIPEDGGGAAEGV